MKILYCAIDQAVPGTKGGAVHVTAVAAGLAALGHEVHVLAAVQSPVDSRPSAVPGPTDDPQLTTDDCRPTTGSVCYHALSPPFGRRELRWLRRNDVLARARELRPDVIIERYYNFGGEGIFAATRLGAIAVLEVNAPVIDYPGSTKQLVDRALLVHPLRRWRDWQCRAADLIVTPSRAIVPAWVPAERVLQIEWGADTDRFRPDARGAVPVERREGNVIAVFAGAFRRWHGAPAFVDAVGRLRAEGRHDVMAVLAGDGPELGRARAAARGIAGILFTGALPHTQMPALLAAADIGVAPFDEAAHPPLALDFYWSPLKIFEYMASGLPVVAPDIPRLRQLITPEREGVLYDGRDADALARTLARLADAGELRRRMGTAARARAEREYSWTAHCRRLDAAIRAALKIRPKACAS